MLETSLSVKCHQVEILLGEKAELSLQSAGASSHSCRADGSCGNLEPKAVVCKVDMGNMSPEDRRVGSLMHNWRNAEEIEQVVVRGLTSPRRKFLVFVVPQSDMASPLLSAMSATRNFDVAARFYDAPGQNEAMLNGAEYVITGGLSKFHAASLFLRKFDLVETYEGYLFLDGDLEFDSDQLSQFLSLAHAVGFSLAQPSVTRDSYCYWNMAYHQPGYIFRDTSFVEVMSPYLSRAALSKALPTFTQSISSYGLDLVWPTLVGNESIAVVDAFQIRHRSTVEHASGSFYKYLKSIGVDLDEEERLILQKYGVTPEPAHSKRGYFWKKRWTFSKEAPELLSVPLYSPEKRTQRQLLIDLAMLRARWTTARVEGTLKNAIEPFLTCSRVSIRSPDQLE